jgi:predicted nucleic acid-binding protein
MVRRVLLDTNLLIAFFDTEGTTSSLEKETVKALMSNLLTDENIVIVITPLIRYEVLRFIKWQQPQKFEQLKAVLDNLTELDITEPVSALATHLYRLDQHECEANNITRNINKRNFDIFHFCSAKQNQLEIQSRNASDFEALEQLYQRYQQTC